MNYSYAVEDSKNLNPILKELMDLVATCDSRGMQGVSVGPISTSVIFLDYGMIATIVDGDYAEIACVSVAHDSFILRVSTGELGGRKVTYKPTDNSKDSMFKIIKMLLEYDDKIYHPKRFYNPAYLVLE